jgi:bifunctional UDP-N-acetylglucosamine pyrophosphorylase/glucosamine-1-phosphate N-acetyltransferase
MRSDSAKVLHGVAGCPMVGHVLNAVERCGASTIVVVVGHQGDAVCDVVGERAQCVWQKQRLGTGHAVAQARKALRGFSGDVLVLYGDVPLITPATLRKLLRTHTAGQSLVTVLGMTVDDPSGYGRIVRDPHGGMRIVEDSDASAMEREILDVNTGTYCFDSAFLMRALARLKSDNAQGEFYLTDLVEAASNEKRAGMLILDDDTETLGVDSRFDLARAEALMQERIIMGWMDKGVTFLDPSSAYISLEAKIGRDTVVGPNVRIDGATSMGTNCRIEGNCHLTDSKFGAGCRLRWGVVAEGAVAAEGAVLGPYAHLRPGAALGRSVHIGNFVEIKNSKIGAGSKANHLAYIGDSEVGRDVNVGAGTITCNYDGFEKHRTVIGDRVQIGSDTQLVAPVVLGDDCFIAAGSTVTRDVEKGALAFNDKRQMSRSGWVESFRRRAAAKRSRK